MICIDGICTNAESHDTLPDGGALPVDKSCEEGKAGAIRTCGKTNAFGTCFGEETCEPAVGWIDCDAPLPAQEECNGDDDDCDGEVDEDLAPSSCEIANEHGTCPGENTCQGTQGLVCSAETPRAETCNARDDDCDEATDEDFVDGSGLYNTTDHCGACGISCVGRIAHAAEATCDTSGDAPACAVVTCEAGYFVFNAVTCASEDAMLCVPCEASADCYGSQSRCMQINPDDPRSFCGRDCGGSGGLSTTCPDNYECSDVAGGAPQCLPVTNDCDCTIANEGLSRPCSRANAHGTCTGQETCIGTTGWTGCSAAEPEPEVCDGADNDCDGLLDEDLVLGQPCEHSNASGTCSGETYCAGVGGIGCTASIPAEEVCDTVDNNCDGTSDEGFMSGGQYIHVNHCGACDNACPDIDGGVFVCDADGGVPTCRLESCAEGTYNHSDLTCLPVPESLCVRCVTDEDCEGPGDRCIDEGEGASFCARDCDVESIYSTTETPCAGDAGVQDCCPDYFLCQEDDEEKVCRPVSGTCACSAAGQLGVCSNTNSFGTCVGIRTCEVDGGVLAWGPCSSGVPAAEICDGDDNDCDGAIDRLDDSLDMSTTPTGNGSCESGPACQGEWICVEEAWTCTAREATGEVCDTIDNNCDGQTDEDFMSGGQYVHASHCGTCDLDCDDMIPHSTVVDCQLVSESPTCVATACETGYFPYGVGTVCMELTDNLCQTCSTDDHCLVPSSSCVTMGPESFCGRSCAGDSPYGVDCPAGYECQDIGFGDLQCVPTAGTCQCSADTLGLTRGC
ncbi:MAG: hypothetical protein GY851_13795, partial [bacterium]|nr:hypothetical protein [bacterium]